jgi:hypothetical protein
MASRPDTSTLKEARGYAYIPALRHAGGQQVTGIAGTGALSGAPDSWCQGFPYNYPKGVNRDPLAVIRLLFFFTVLRVLCG